MKQLISVRAIIRDNDKTLLLRRATGRQTILKKYELPGGKISYGEQPEDAVRRYLSNDVGVTTKSAQLHDVLTYVDHDDRDTQYTFIVYIVNVEAGSKVRLSQNYDKYSWKHVKDFETTELTESSRLLLSSAGTTTNASAGTSGDSDKIIEHISDDPTHIIIYSDGGSRGNPGPSASGFVMLNSHLEVIHQGGVYLGITTNNQAEYHGVRLGLEKAAEIGARTIDFRLDSMLVVNQLNGLYVIKNRELWPINERVKELAATFDKVSFRHVRREFNQLADGMVNKILNAHEFEAKKFL